MSVKAMSAVWEHSRHKGSELLTLLAIADHADDTGKAYPSIEKLAKKTRMTDRNTQFVLRKLETSQELTIYRNEGPHGTHLFQINLDVVKSFQGEKFSGVKKFQGENQRQKPNLLQPQISPEPSLREPSVEEENSLTTFESSAASVNGVHEPASPDAAEGELLPAKPKRKSKPPPAPLATDDWLYTLLCEYSDRFDIAALNDDEWWTDIGNSFQEFTQPFVSLAFADLAVWLRDNPKRAPRNAAGWKSRMRISLNFYYDRKWSRRTTPRGTYTKR